MADLQWLRVEPRALDNREDLAVVYTTNESTVLFSEREGKLYKTQGGHWYRGIVQE